MMSNAFRPASKDLELQQPPPDSISQIAFSPTQDILAIGSWDNGVSGLSNLLSPGSISVLQLVKSKSQGNFGALMNLGHSSND